MLACGGPVESRKIFESEIKCAPARWLRPRDTIGASSKSWTLEKGLGGELLPASRRSCLPGEYRSTRRFSVPCRIESTVDPASGRPFENGLLNWEATMWRAFHTKCECYIWIWKIWVQENQGLRYWLFTPLIRVILERLNHYKELKYSISSDFL